MYNYVYVSGIQAIEALTAGHLASQARKSLAANKKELGLTKQAAQIATDHNTQMGVLCLFLTYNVLWRSLRHFLFSGGVMFFV